MFFSSDLVEMLHFLAQFDTDFRPFRCFQMLQECHLLAPPGVINEELTARYDAVLRSLSSWITKTEVVLHCFEFLSMVADREIMKLRAVKPGDNELLSLINRAVASHSSSKQVQRAALQLFESILENAKGSQLSSIADRIFKSVLDNLLLNGEDNGITYAALAILLRLWTPAKSIISPWTDQIINICLDTILRRASPEICAQCIALITHLTEDREAFFTIARHPQGFQSFLDGLDMLRAQHINAAIAFLELLLRILEDYDIALAAFQSIPVETNAMDFAQNFKDGLKEKFDKYINYTTELDDNEEENVKLLFFLYSSIDELLLEMMKPEEDDDVTPSNEAHADTTAKTDSAEGEYSQQDDSAEDVKSLQSQTSGHSGSKRSATQLASPARSVGESGDASHQSGTSSIAGDHQPIESVHVPIQEALREPENDVLDGSVDSSAASATGNDRVLVATAVPVEAVVTSVRTSGSSSINSRPNRSVSSRATMDERDDVDDTASSKSRAENNSTGLSATELVQLSRDLDMRDLVQHQEELHRQDEAEMRRKREDQQRLLQSVTKKHNSRSNVLIDSSNSAATPSQKNSDGNHHADDNSTISSHGANNSFGGERILETGDYVSVSEGTVNDDNSSMSSDARHHQLQQQSQSQQDKADTERRTSFLSATFSFMSTNKLNPLQHPHTSQPGSFAQRPSPQTDNTPSLPPSHQPPSQAGVVSQNMPPLGKVLVQAAYLEDLVRELFL